MEDTELEEGKKFVFTRGMLILLIFIVVVIIIITIILVKKMRNNDKLSMDDFEKLEQRMIEEAPIYIYQKNIELTEEEIKINLKDMLDENGGTINSDKMPAVKKCDGYVIATKKEVETYKAYISCGDNYITSGYVSNNKKTTTKKLTTKKDKEKPVITLIGDSEISLFVGDTYQEKGAKAKDNIDGDITSKVVINGKVDTSKPGTYEVSYVVSDKSGNESSKTRIVIVNEKPTTTTTSTKQSTTKATTTKQPTNKTTTKQPTNKTTTRPVSAPIIILNGSKTIYLNSGENYVEPGYTASDGNGKNITESVVVTGNINKNVSGTYVRTYSVTDSYGNVAVTTRTIIVKANSVAVSNVTITPNSYDLLVGDTVTLVAILNPTNATNKNVSWSSSDTSVASVSSGGVVSARKKGTAIITVKSSNGKTASAKITVK